MEWVETTGRSVQEAKERALDELGVDETDAEFEVIAEAQTGLFGRLRSEARVRARVRPTAPRAKEDRRDRRRRSGSGSSGGSSGAEPGGGSPGGGRGRSARGGGPSAADAGGSAAETTASAAQATPAAAATGGPGAATASSSAGAGTQEPQSGSGGRGSTSTGTPGDVGGDAGDEAEPGGSPGSQRKRRRGGGKRNRSGPATGGPSGAMLGDQHPRSDDDDDRSKGPQVEVALDRQAEVASEFLNQLTAEFGLEATVTVAHPDEETVELQLSGPDLGILIGPKGATLLAVQSLTRTIVFNETGGTNGHINVDVGGYRQKRTEALARFANQVAERVKTSGTRAVLEPMSSIDRKVVHDTIAGIEGVTTISEGEEPRRRVVVEPG